MNNYEIPLIEKAVSPSNGNNLEALQKIANKI